MFVLYLDSGCYSKMTFGDGEMEDDKQMLQDKFILEKIVMDLDKNQIKQLLLIIHRMQEEAS